jgi:hypothetical protein
MAATAHHSIGYGGIDQRKADVCASIARTIHRANEANPAEIAHQETMAPARIIPAIAL